MVQCVLAKNETTGSIPVFRSMIIHGPKYVKVANMWIVTLRKDNREIPNWFGSKEEADKFVDETWEEFRKKLEG